MPSSLLLQGVYIDDHLLMLDCLSSTVSAWTGIDRDAAEKAHKAYAADGLTRAPETVFGFARVLAPGQLPNGDTTFLAWGTLICSRSGKVGAPMPKRFQLFCLGLELSEYDRLPKICS